MTARFVLILMLALQPVYAFSAPDCHGRGEMAAPRGEHSCCCGDACPMMAETPAFCGCGDGEDAVPQPWQPRQSDGRIDMAPSTAPIALLPISDVSRMIAPLAAIVYSVSAVPLNILHCTWRT